MTDLATHCETVHVHLCVHAASSCLQIFWSVALEKKKKKKKEGKQFGDGLHNYESVLVHLKCIDR